MASTGMDSVTSLRRWRRPSCWYLCNYLRIDSRISAGWRRAHEVPQGVDQESRTCGAEQVFDHRNPFVDAPIKLSLR